jgi:hypothetical protein
MATTVISARTLIEVIENNTPLNKMKRRQKGSTDSTLLVASIYLATIVSIIVMYFLIK